MNTTQPVENRGEPSLQPPGAGLPAVEARFFRHGLPLLAKAISVESARKMFLREGHAILYVAQDLADWDLEERVLVKRPFGIEDNSRFWSIEMLLEHLMIVGNGIRDVIRQLSIGVRPNLRMHIADAKPKGGLGPDVREKFSYFLEHFLAGTGKSPFPPRPTHPHPWIGEMNAAQWFKFAALHHWMHRVHAERVVAGLDPS